MIGRISGKILEEEEGGVLVIDVGGVGYEIIAPIGTRGRVEQQIGDTVTLHVHTHVREDALTLFGFASHADRIAFRTLIGVSNVGPKTAINVLSILPGPELARVIAANDLRRLTGIPGIGKKTAERLLLELRDKLPALESEGAARGPAPAKPKTGGTQTTDVLLSALTNMGYRPSEAERAVMGMDPALFAGKPVMSDLLRQALALLAK
ncbi:MAG: Holliday junction branch migration protein RuvA [Polyangiaceae bacterium]